jgi:hypothetical protein
MKSFNFASGNSRGEHQDLSTASISKPGQPAQSTLIDLLLSINKLQAYLIKRTREHSKNRLLALELSIYLNNPEFDAKFSFEQREKYHRKFRTALRQVDNLERRIKSAQQKIASLEIQYLQLMAGGIER